MRGSSLSRLFALIACVVLAASVVAGCGGGDNGSQTGEGAPSGAKGNAAGGAAVEAGKQRNPNDVKQEKEAFSQEPPPVQLQTGDKSGLIVSSPKVVIINSNAEMKGVAKKLYSRGVNSQTIPPVDFKTRQGVLVQLPAQPRGTLMQIQDIHSAGGKIVVRAARILPGKGCKTAGYRPNPYNLVETRKMSGTPVLNLDNVRSSPC
jgi:hypothetical protein